MEQAAKTLMLRSSSRPRKNEDAPALLYYQFLGGPVEPVYEEITKPQQLIEYLIQTDITKNVESQFKIPFVMLFNDMIIDVKHGNFDPKLTSPENPIKICWKYIQNEKYSLNFFFHHRGIKPDIGFLSKRLFRSAIEMLQDKAFLPSEGDVLFIQKSAVARRNRKNEGPVAPLVAAVLTACLDETDLKTTYIEEQYSFVDKESHEATADHVIFKTATYRPILICKDKFDQINEGILQNFDQLRTFAETEHGRHFDMIYGITSNFDDWVFCCYFCPEEGKDVTADNFLISNTYKINYDPLGSEPVADSIKDIIQRIRGFLKADIDKIVIESLNKEGVMMIEEKGNDPA